MRNRLVFRNFGFIRKMFVRKNLSRFVMRARKLKLFYIDLDL